MKKLTIAVALLLCAVLCLGLAACDGGGNDEKTVKAVLIAPMSGGAYWQPFEEGWRAAGAARGFEKTDFWAPTTGNDRAAMADLCETAIIQGYNVIALPVGEADVFNDVLTRAKAAGIYVVAINVDASGLANVLVGVNMYAQGKESSKLISDAAKADGVTDLNIVAMQISLGGTYDDTTRGMVDGLKEALGESHVKLIATDYSNSSAPTAQDKFNAYYLTNNELNCCLGGDVTSAAGALAFIRENNLVGKVYAFAYDNTVETLRAIREGALCGAFIYAGYPTGEFVAEIAEKIVNGEQSDDFYQVPIVKITKENVEQYAADNGIELD